MKETVSATTIQRLLCERLDLPQSRASLWSSGTSAFRELLDSIGIAPEDEIILPISICESMILAVSEAGAVPVLADCNEDFALDIGAMQRCVNAKTRLVVIHHPFGFAVDLCAYRRALADFPNIFLVEDCAQSLGAHGPNGKVGQVGDFAIYSFGARKPMSAAGGGMLVVNAERYLDVAQTAATKEELGRSLLEALRQAVEDLDAQLEARLRRARALVAGWTCAAPLRHAASVDVYPYRSIFLRMVVDAGAGRAGALHARLSERIGGQWAVPVWERPRLDLSSLSPLTQFATQAGAELRPAYPGWNSCAERYLLVRTGPEVTQDQIDAFAANFAATYSEIKAEAT